MGNSIDTLNLNKTPQKKEKISHYKGVTWHKKSRKWYASVYHKGHKRKYGGMFNEELDAAKRVNQICEELNISPQNPNIQQSPTDDELLTSEEKEDEDFITEFLAGEQNTLKKSANVKKIRTEINKQKNNFTLLKTNNGAETDDKFFVVSKEKEDEDFITEFLMGEQNKIIFL